MANIAVRFVIGSGNVDFYAEEIAIENIVFSKQTVFLPVQTHADVVDQRGDEWQSFEIQFIEYYSTTRAKITSILDENDEMTLYYDYLLNTTTNAATVICLPNAYEKIYRWGELGAYILHRITFLQTS